MRIRLQVFQPGRYFRIQSLTIAEPGTNEVETAELCRALGIKRNALQTWIRKGIPRERRKGPDGVWRNYFDPGKVRAWIQAGGPGKPGRPAMEHEGEGSAGADNGDLTAALKRERLRKIGLECQRLEQELDEKRGRLVDIETVQAANVAKFSAIRTALEAIPGRVAGDAMRAKTRGEAERLIRDEIGRALRELVHGRRPGS